MEKQKRLVRYFVLLVFSLILFLVLTIFSMMFVSAAPAITITSPVTFTNYTTTMSVSITNTLVNSTDVNDYNVTLYCNKSGGRATNISSQLITTIWNDSAFDSAFTATVTITGFTDAINYNCSAFADNGTQTAAGTGWTVASIKNITIDNTAPNVSFAVQTNAINNGNYSGIITLNASVNDLIMGVDSVYFNITSSNNIQVNFTRAILASGGGVYYNLTIDTTQYTDGKYNITVYANDTQLNNLNSTERIQIVIDNIPTVTFSCSPVSVTAGYPVTCTCSGTAASGVNTTVFTASPPTSSSGVFTETCTVTNYVGNSVSATATYAVYYSGGGTPSGGGGGGSAAKTDTNSWTKITPGVAAIMKDFDKDMGVKQIQIEVNNPAQNVQIIVNKYNSKPANVSVEKSDTYKYLSIVTKNLANNLSKAIIELQVNKSWVSSKGIDKADIALFKYDSSANKWNELTTTFKEEDSLYYYYDTELTSFSFFAIAPKEKPPITEEVQQETSLEEQEEQRTFLEKLPVWAWIIIAVIILAIIFLVFNLKKKKKRKKK